ncbi:hypothetical protein [Arcanobacterium bovis]|uniref:CBM6 domain-containing protein n=1 Tax=Arcanobacterium bovis TaxID=2529275 RepID=A0A4Q9V0C2_9ACTO|nr:hypothetical protein [Arcanobacterium bovis]TBW22103.1 hypothetical protein EZJ44_04555 [Arcanobacterium bovis]
MLKGALQFGGVGNDATLNQVYVPADGVYELSLEYRSGEPRSVTGYVNDNQTVVLSKLSTGSSSGFATEKCGALLKQGWNTVRFLTTAVRHLILARPRFELRRRESCA